ncbi:transmembrane and TPR repeat-containing protein 4-like isoform X3 [Octopus vulgaris]|uniref:dolichyl-phosphate-mannose--protein mannosyltransferase n=2 Tax=Octopus vulgaris TaxID=6645 RepID=A0AA36AQF7_OCTVU|nr:transmembrane and TPR repeat-containing protein 4-like isoform X3 [Octopus vulgaris]
MLSARMFFNSVVEFYLQIIVVNHKRDNALDIIRMKYLMKDVKDSKLDYLMNLSRKAWTIWILYIILVTTLAFVANIVTINGTFIFDDREALVKNADVNNLRTPITSLFVHDFWGKNISSPESHKSYRPITIIALRLQHHLFGSLNPKSFHKFNIGLHVLNSLMCLGVTATIWGKTEKHKEGILLASSLFAVHPIHTETVASVVGQADMLYTMFSLLGFLIYHYGLMANKNNKGNTFLRNVNCLLVVSMLTVLSTFSKEQGITTMVTIFYLLFRIFFMVAITLLLLTFRLKLMIKQPVFNKEDNPHSFVDNFLLRVVNYSYIYWLNTWLLLDPWWLCCDWSYDCIPILNSPWNFRTLAALSFWILIVMMSYRILLFRNTSMARKISLSLIFWIVPFTPASNMFFRVGFVIAERNLYLPSLGFCIAISLGFCILRESHPHRSQILKTAAVCLTFVFIVRSHQRNKDWLDGKRLFHSGLKVCPNNAKLYFNIAVGYLHHKEYKSAKNYFSETVRKYPEFVSAYTGLGQCYMNLENYTKAEYYYQIATNISSQMDREDVLWNLCYVKFKLKKMEEAEHCINTLIHNYPLSAYKAYYGLAEIYYYNGEKQKALQAWMKAIELNSTDSAAWESVVAYLHHLNRRKESEEVFLRALNHVTEPTSLQNIWARLHQKEHHPLGESRLKKR